MNLAKDAFLGGLSFLGLPSDRAVILMYHSIREAGPFFTVTPKAFAHQMGYLKRKGYSVISLTELVNRLQRRNPLGGSVVITFDDGYRDNYETAFPVLKQHAFPATIFVTTDLIGKTDERGMAHLSAVNMKEMEESRLIDIEPHAKGHPHLTSLPISEAKAQIEGSKELLESMLGKTCRHFAYPYGDFTDDTTRMVHEAGFVSAVSVQEGSVGVSANVFTLPRVSVDSSTTAAQFRGKVSRAVDVYEHIKKAV